MASTCQSGLPNTSLPPGARENALGSARFQAEYTPQERTIISNLLSIEPYQP